MNKTIAALFDLDGVILDTESQYSIFWNSIGLKYFCIEDWGSSIKGQTLVQIYDKHFPLPEFADERENITKELDEWERNMTYNYIDGAKEFLETLKEKGIKCAVVTSSNDEKMKNVFRCHPEFNELFDRILTAEMFTRSKPAPDCYLLGARVFGAEIENCIVFEDSFHGLESGRRAKMKVVGLATTNAMNSIKDKCDIAINDFTEFSFDKMMKLIGNIN